MFHLLALFAQKWDAKGKGNIMDLVVGQELKLAVRKCGGRR